MFATAVKLLARRSAVHPPKLSSAGEQIESASQALHKILEQHGPITASDAWNHASKVLPYLILSLFPPSLQLHNLPVQGLEWHKT